MAAVELAYILLKKKIVFSNFSGAGSECRGGVGWGGVGRGGAGWGGVGRGGAGWGGAGWGGGGGGGALLQPVKYLCAH